MEYTFNVAQAAQEMGVCTKEALSLLRAHCNQQSTDAFPAFGEKAKKACHVHS